MKRTLLSILGWCAATGSLYAAALLLDVYWNIIDWRPQGGWITGGLFAWIAAALTGIWFLARASLPTVSRIVGLLASLALLAAAVNALPAETRSEGLLGRDELSPSWYRVARLVLLALPALAATGALVFRKDGPSPARADLADRRSEP